MFSHSACILWFLLFSNSLYDGFAFRSLPINKQVITRRSFITSFAFGGRGGNSIGGNDDSFGKHDDDDDDEPEDITVPNSGSNRWDAEAIGEPDGDDALIQGLNPVASTQLEEVLQEAVTDMAIKTSTFYSEEFRDDVSKQFLMNFNNFKKDGFGQKGWRGYLDDMIRTDKYDVLITLIPPKSVLKANNLPPDANCRVQYTTKIEPRKIANQICTIRENIINELMDDLGCIKNENNEAARIAALWTNKGSYEEAQKSRRPTRMSDQHSSTPFRDTNFHDIDVLVTNIAIDLFRSDELHQHSNPKEHAKMVSYIDNLIAEISSEFETKDPTFQILNRFVGPRTLLERLYHNGLQGGVVASGTDNINVLKLAQEIFKLRLMVSREGIRLLSSISLSSRYYYKLIKDCGGFSRIDLSGRPKYTIVNLDEERRKEEILREEASAAKLLKDRLLTTTISAKNRNDNNNNTTENDNNNNGSDVDDINVVTENDNGYMDDDNDAVFGGGPIMM